jgi:ankyrin repeat protein
VTHYGSAACRFLLKQAGAKLLIAHGADVNKINDLESDEPRTAVHVASIMGSVSMLEVLMQGGASMTACAGECRNAVNNTLTLPWLCVLT